MRISIAGRLVIAIGENNIKEKLINKLEYIVSLSNGQTSMQSASYFIDSTMTTVGTKTIITASVRLASGQVYNNGDVLKITLPSDTTGAWDTSTTPVCTCVRLILVLTVNFISLQQVLRYLVAP